MTTHHEATNMGFFPSRALYILIPDAPPETNVSVEAAVQWSMRRFAGYAGFLLDKEVKVGGKVRIAVDPDLPPGHTIEARFIEGDLRWPPPMRDGIPAPHYRGPVGQLPESIDTPQLLCSPNRLPLPTESGPVRQVYQLGILSIVHGARDPETQRAAAFFWDFDHRSHPELLARHYGRIADWEPNWVRYLLDLDPKFRKRLIARVEQRRRDPHWQPEQSDAQLLHCVGIHEGVLRPLCLKYYPDLGSQPHAKRAIVRDCIAFASGRLAIRHDPALKKVPVTNGGPDSPAIFMFAEFALLLVERERRGRSGKVWGDVLAAFASMQAVYKESFGRDAPVTWRELCRRHDEMDLTHLTPERAREIEEQYVAATDPVAIASEYSRIVHGMLSDQYFPPPPKP